MAKRGLWANIHAKRKRIKAGSGERMRKKGAEGAPTEEQIKNSQEMGGKRSKFGMLSVKAGIDNNPNPTQADRIAGATSKKKKGGMKYKPGGKRKKKMMGVKQPKAMYEKGGFLSEPSVFDLDND